MSLQDEEMAGAIEDRFDEALKDRVRQILDRMLEERERGTPQGEEPERKIARPVVGLGDTEPQSMFVVSEDFVTPPDGRRFWTEGVTWYHDKKGRPDPNFTVMEAAKFFFGKKPDWLRWRTEGDKTHPQGWFILDGQLVEPTRTPSNARLYTLYDIERMAHALTQTGGIDAEELVTIISLVRGCGRLHGYDV